MTKEDKDYLLDLHMITVNAVCDMLQYCTSGQNRKALETTASDYIIQLQIRR